MKRSIEIVVAIIVGIAILIVNRTNHQSMEDDEKLETEGNTKLKIVTSLEDEISDNTAWCGTFNLIWNDLKNEIAKQDIIFTEGQMPTVDHLNKGTFTVNELSENSYYKVYDHPTPQLKEEIKKAIKEKFNETSAILDSFDFENSGENDYFLYSMLKKEFHFPKVFTKLEEGKFRDVDHVKYFGIDSSTNEEVRNQVKVLYYHGKDDFALVIDTQENDEVIITRGNAENNFLDIYQNMLEQANLYAGKKSFTERDTLKIPNIHFDLKEEITDVENKQFFLANGMPYAITTALQTIEFDLDEKGGKIKSEAGIIAKNTAVMEPPEKREFIADDTFTIFLREKEKDLPYFAAKISDIKQVQEVE